MSYAAELASAWAAHLAPRAADAPTVVSTFAGCGGSSLGYSMAGYRELLAVEWDAHACEVFALNFPDVPLHRGDITDLDPSTVDLPAAGLDVLDGSPPCQGFSMAGARRVTDSRNSLVGQYIRLLDAWAPRAFVMENVPGMVVGKMRPVFVDILRALRTAGPGYRVDVRQVAAMYFGVPQVRRRLVFLGVRADLGMDPPVLRPTARPVSVRDALAELDDPGEAPVPAGKAAILTPHILPGRNGSDVLMPAGRGHAWYGVARAHWDRPVSALPRMFATGFVGTLHPEEDRYVGSRELARLGSFPDGFDWGTSPYKLIHNRIGNSVPPLMMRAVATAVRTTLEGVTDGQARTAPQADSAAAAAR